MAQLDELNVKIQADVKQLIAGFDNATKEMKDFASTGKASLNTLGDAYKALEKKQKEFTVGSKDFATYSTALNQVGSSIKEAKGAADKGFGQIKTGAAQAGSALTDLGRVAQDAPFGFVAISNNLNPLLESFGRLKTETGSGKAALSALAGSLMGAGGLGIAFSLVTSALTFATVGFGAWTRGMGDSNKKVEEGKTKIEEYKKTLEDISKNVSSEATQITSLVAVIESETASRNKKKDALQQLQKLQPEIFNGLKLEGEAVAGLDIAYQKYVANLNTVIAAKIKQKQIEDITTKILEKQGATLTKSEKDLKNAFKIDPNVLKEDGSGALNASAQKKIYLKQQDEEAKKQAELNSLYSDQKALFEDLKDLQSGIKVDEVKDEKVKKVKDYKDIIAELRKEIAGLQTSFNFNQIDLKELASGMQNAYKKAINDLGEIKAPIKVIQGIANELNIKVDKFKINDEPLTVPIEVPVKLKPTVTQKEAEKMLEDTKRLQDELRKYGVDPSGRVTTDEKGITKITDKGLFDLDNAKKQIDALKNIYVEGFTSIGTSIGEALAKGDLSNLGADLFTGLFQTIGNGLTTLGKQMIETFVLVKILKTSFATLNPAAGLFAGIALVAIGTALKGVKIGNNASGTDNWRGGLSWVGEKGPELINLPRGSSVIPNHKAMQGIQGVGMGQSVFIPSITLRGADMLVAFNRATAINKRNT